MIYKEGDRVYYGGKGGSKRVAEIIKIDYEEKDINYKYCIRYNADFGRDYTIWTGADCFEGFVAGHSPEERLKQGLEKLLDTFSKEEIISVLEDI